jgi:copper chaperone NosL
LERGSMRKGLMSWVLIFCFALVSYATEDPDTIPNPKEKCPVCGMFVSMFADWNAEIRFDDNIRAIFDGSKDLFKYYLDLGKYNPSKNKDQIKVVLVKDYYSKFSFDAGKAFYVIWSDVYGPMGHEPIPFEKEAEAKKFLKEHKGKKILRFKDITLKLMRSLDNP